MKLQNERALQDEYYCELTTKLDELAGITEKSPGYDFGFRHYILAEQKDKEQYGGYAIRIPGGTLGTVSIDNDDVITEVFVDTNYVVKTYVKDVNEQLKQFIGQKLEF